MRRSAVRSSGTAILSSKILTPAPASDLPPPRKLHKRRRSTNPIYPGARSRRDGGASSGRRSGPATPLLRWSFDDADRSAEHPPEFGSGKVQRKHQNVAGEAAPAVSARKLAAALWQLQLPEASGGCGDREPSRLGFESDVGHLHAPYDCDPNITSLRTNTKNELSSPISIHDPKNDIIQKLEASAALSNCAMERATKWDPGCAKASDEVYGFYGHQKLLEDQQLTTVSVVSGHQAELKQARNRISELEAERRSAKKKLDHFLKKLAEEKSSWRKREHEKIRAVMDAMKDDLNRERKNRQRMEIMNSKLVSELAEAKLLAKRCLQDYEKERKARELMEEVCDELAKEIGEDKAEVEALKRESMKIREEVEEERKMLQMAEVWREERVQMKLVDAKLTLEEKYSQLSKLQKDLEAFLKERSGNHPDLAELKEAEMLREAAKSLKVQEVREFSYQPPSASEDIFAVFEELQPREEINEREIEQCYRYSPPSHASDVQTESPETDMFLEQPMKRYANGIIEINGDMEDDSGWETVSHVEEQGSSNSPEGSDPSVNGIYRKSNASVSGIDWDENGDNGKLNSEITEVCSATTRQSRKKASSISRLWRSSCPNNGENYKKISFEVTNGRLPNGRKSNATLSPDRKSGEVGLSSPSAGQWISPDSLNHITRGMKGCIEWPRGMQKHSLKAKLLEARMESQKVQLRHVLKQKI
ncbi:uncharacterized protein [Elaeis guineensis]|uniref:Uncharacterized protein At5g41620 n=1 Tax=Elaeis guineensis var. tenera TaxID=51953 RepID=A0A6I9RXP5_ELAGV|nr:uncharacterized protein At5g41620 [Elaeis guineensis]